MSADDPNCGPFEYTIRWASIGDDLGSGDAGRIAEAIRVCEERDRELEYHLQNCIAAASSDPMSVHLTSAGPGLVGGGTNVIWTVAHKTGGINVTQHLANFIARLHDPGIYEAWFRAEVRVDSADVGGGYRLGVAAEWREQNFDYPSYPFAPGGNPLFEIFMGPTVFTVTSTYDIDFSIDTTGPNNANVTRCECFVKRIAETWT